MTVSQKVTLFRESSWFEPFSSEKNPFVMPAIFWNSESLLTKKKPSYITRVHFDVEWHVFGSHKLTSWTFALLTAWGQNNCSATVWQRTKYNTKLGENAVRCNDGFRRSLCLQLILLSNYQLWKRRTEGSFFLFFYFSWCSHIPEDINLSTMYTQPLGLVFHPHRKAYL